MATPGLDLAVRGCIPFGTGLSACAVTSVTSVAFCSCFGVLSLMIPGMSEQPVMDIRTRLRAESGAALEQAVTLALELRRLGFSHRTVVFELCRHHGYEKGAATRVVRIAAVRDFPPDPSPAGHTEPAVDMTAAVMIAELAACVEAIEAKA
jgi:hypothetical protein